ncbi:MAG: type I DNA topoisomerase [Spirochaetia bacterium]|nr:type I DNA topoisomerase [Spirochaetia bacterium]
MAKKEKKNEKNSSQNKKLVIVESPTKIKSLSKFLDKNYIIQSSKGHLIDLPKSSMGVNIENGFEPKYITIRGKGKTLAELKKAAKKSKEILLATDPDREGEAISWHLKNVLLSGSASIKRIEFNEITKEAVLEAIKNPRDIDILKVNSQQARRILDRIVGYSISPILQEKLGAKRFSAGRVQSAALKIICDREEEIEKFTPKEYWEIDALFSKEGGAEINSEHIFRLLQVNQKKTDVKSQAEADKIENLLKKSEFTVAVKKTTERRTKPLAPYTTSKLQQEASTRLGFRAGKTMSVAQSLYEGVEMADGGVTGLITYMRTDSTRISEAGLKMARDYISENFDKNYLPDTPNIYAGKKNAQDAHEAVRPTSVEKSPKKIAAFLSKDQLKLYTLIWNRFVASQMTPAVDEIVSLDVKAPADDELFSEFLFRLSSANQKFSGFRAVFSSGDAKKSSAPDFNENDKLSLEKLDKRQKFTQPLPRYTEASLIKIMEESGIGRPATYVPTIATLDKRGYVERKGRQFLPTTLGRVINRQVVAFFPEIVNLEFTAKMEKRLDSIASGNANWRETLQNFYDPLKNELEIASKSMEDLSHLIRIPLARECPQCQAELFKKLGKNGYFIGCGNFAGGCRYTESISLGTCPRCGGNVVKKASKKGRPFYGCENYHTQNCEFIMTEKPAEKSCVKCGSIMGERVKKTGIVFTCQNKDCAYTVEEKNDDG